MVLYTLYLGCLVLGFIHTIEAKCHDKNVEYWERQYSKNYFGDLEPWSRCKAEHGTCMREKDTCDSGDWVRYQTKCHNKCECCFRKKRIRDEVDWVLVKNRLTWDEAREDCRKEKNGDLVVPENVDDLIRFIERKDLGTADIWVGINDKFNGRFEGIYGNEIIDGWQEGHPKRQSRYKDNCVVVEDRSDRSGEDEVGMKVEPCWAKNYYVCDVNRNNRRRHDVFIDKAKSRWDDSNEREDEDEDEDEYDDWSREKRESLQEEAILS